MCIIVFKYLGKHDTSGSLNGAFYFNSCSHLARYHLSTGISPSGVANV